MEERITLIVEGIDPYGRGTWGFRIRTKRPGGQFHTICSWLPMQHVTDTTVTEQMQVIDDCWLTLLKQFVGIQQTLV